MSTQLYLPKDYKPQSTDVIIGRGKKCYSHEGNNRLRFLVASRLNEYAKAATKREKSKVLVDVVNQIRTGSPNGKFIRHDKASKLWFDIGDDHAKEKISQFFRNALNESQTCSFLSQKKRQHEMDKDKRPSMKRARLNKLNESLPNSLFRSPSMSLCKSDSVFQVVDLDTKYLFGEMKLQIDPLSASQISVNEKSVQKIPTKSFKSKNEISIQKNCNKGAVDDIGELEDIDTSGLLPLDVDSVMSWNNDTVYVW